MQHAVKAGIVHADLLRQLLARLGRTGEQVEGKPARGNTTLTLNLLGDGAQFVVVATQQDNAGAIARVGQGRANWGAYAVSKFATEGMMQVLADEYQSRHLRVNCINPGGTRTGMRASAFPTEDPLKLKTPADIMPVYLWLMGDDSRRKTGMTFDAQPGRKPGIAQ